MAAKLLLPERLWRWTNHRRNDAAQQIVGAEREQRASYRGTFVVTLVRAHRSTPRFGRLPRAMSSSPSTRPARVSPIRLALGEAAFVLLLGLLLFVPAGTTHWPRAWVLLGVLAVSRIAGLARLYRLSPALLAERAKGPLQRGQPLADKLLLPAFMASYAGLIAFTAADCFRLDLLGRTSALAAGAGLVAVVAGSLLVFAALSENAYATMVVRHQAEREQRVIDGGVYGWVRHPMYAGVALMQLASRYGWGPWLARWDRSCRSGSWWCGSRTRSEC